MVSGGHYAYRTELVDAEHAECSTTAGRLPRVYTVYDRKLRSSRTKRIWL